MAGFKTHITVSSLLGIGGGTAAYLMYDVPWPTCALAAGMCGVAGMLPDIDSDSGRPLHESLAFAAAVVPMMVLHKLRHSDLSHELMILAGAGAYLLVRFGLGFLLKHFTVHRGMFHSLPAAAIFGEIAFLLAPSEERRVEAVTGRRRRRRFSLALVARRNLQHRVEPWSAAEEIVRYRLETVESQRPGRIDDLCHANGAFGRIPAPTGVVLVATARRHWRASGRPPRT